MKRCHLFFLIDKSTHFEGGTKEGVRDGIPLYLFVQTRYIGFDHLHQGFVGSDKEHIIRVEDLLKGFAPVIRDECDVALMGEDHLQKAHLMRQQVEELRLFFENNIAQQFKGGKLDVGDFDPRDFVIVFDNIVTVIDNGIGTVL